VDPWRRYWRRFLLFVAVVLFVAMAPAVFATAAVCIAFIVTEIETNKLFAYKRDGRKAAKHT
jgi:hypothetical protein